MTSTSTEPEAGPSGIALPVTPFSRAVDRLIGWVGEVASALWLVLVLVIVVQVVARYAFGTGSIAMEELQWHIYAIGFMLGLSFTEMRERNVRIDVLAERFSHRTRLRIELFGLLLLFLPLTLFVLWCCGAVLLVVVRAQGDVGRRRRPALPLVPQVLHHHRLRPAGAGGPGPADARLGSAVLPARR